MEFSAMRLHTARGSLAKRPPFHAANRFALLQAHGKVQHPSIRSVTRGGIRLDGAFGLNAGDPVSVKLSSQHTVDGTVDWSVAGFCGVVFAMPLAEDDPALIAG